MKNHTLNPIPHTLILAVIGVLTIFTLTACDDKAVNTFTDSRDGKAYKTVKIGKQVWMAENLNYEAKGSLCYDNKKENCAKYGRLYDWNTAMKACPSGWHLPSKEEWQVLVDVAGGNGEAGKNLKAANGWNDYEGKSGNGEDKFGFSALPGGRGYYSGGFLVVGESGDWWSANERTGDYAYNRNMSYEVGYVHDYDADKRYGFSVRCVKD
jgi:uncharacterized protein (TIGR02145 family)